MTVRLTARCVRGLEWVLAAEIAGRDGVGEVQLSERQVSFDAELGADLLGLRTADDLLLDLEVLHGIDHTRAALADLARTLALVDFDGALARLEEVRTLPAKPSFDVVASLLGRRNYNRFAVEDAAGQVVEDALGARYVSRNPSGGGGSASDAAFVDTDLGHTDFGHTDFGHTDFTVRVSLSGETAQVALRLPGRPLHRRAWKLDTGPGTLHPPLAAALVRIGAGPDSTTAIDPFCGDGTIAIETALARPDLPILAADLDPERLRNARANAERAGVSARIEFVQTDAGQPSWGTDAGTDTDTGHFDLVVTNPPWNRIVGASGALTDSLDPFWQHLPAALGPHARICTVAEAELDVPARLRRHGYSVSLTQTIRLAGRVSQVVLAAPPDAPRVELSDELSRWRGHAIKIGIVSPEGF
jgi:tRNA (guanine6-N2)-methyltransferase